MFSIYALYTYAIYGFLKIPIYRRRGFYRRWVYRSCCIGGEKHMAPSLGYRKRPTCPTEGIGRIPDIPSKLD